MLGAGFGMYGAAPLRFVQQINDYTPLTTASNTQITPLDFKVNNRTLDPSNTSQDSYITDLINAVFQYFEDYTGFSILTTSWKGQLSSTVWSDIALSKKTVSSITSIKYYPFDWNFTDAATTLPATFTYQDPNQGPITSPTYRIETGGFKTNTIIEMNINYTFTSLYISNFNITVEFETDILTIDAALKRAMLAHANFLYMSRGDDNFVGYREFNSNVLSVYNKYKTYLSVNRAGGLAIL